MTVGHLCDLCPRVALYHRIYVAATTGNMLKHVRLRYEPLERQFLLCFQMGTVSICSSEVGEI